MKRIFAGVAAALLAVALFFPCSAVSASSAILLDGQTGRVLYEKQADKQSLIASTTKIMTCILAIENGNLDEVITVDDSVLKSYGSGIYISVGEKIKLIDLLYGLMLRSGNDAALAIAKYVESLTLAITI